MGKLILYAADASDISTRGLGEIETIGQPFVEWEAGGMYEMEFEVPLDKNGRWKRIQKSMMVKAKVPIRENPFHEFEIPEEYTGTIIKQLYKVDANWLTVHYEFDDTDNSKILFTMYQGERFTVEEFTDVVPGANPPISSPTTINGTVWAMITSRIGGRGGWVRLSSGGTTYASFDKEVQEEFQNGRPVSNDVIDIKQSSNQLFRIYGLYPDLKEGKMAVKARHIFYDLAYNLIIDKYEAKDQSANSAIWGIVNKLFDHHFTFYTMYLNDESIEKVNGEWEWTSPVDALLGSDGVVGQARIQVIRDNYVVHFLEDTPNDFGVTIRERKNVRGLTIDDDISDVTTHIIPCGKDNSGKEEKELWLSDAESDRVIVSEYADRYPFPRYQKVDYDVTLVKSGDKEIDHTRVFGDKNEARSKLSWWAYRDIYRNEVDKPKYTINIEFAQLEQSDLYPEYAHLQMLRPYDTAKVVSKTMDVVAKLRVTHYKWDPVHEKYIELTLGRIEDLSQSVFSYNFGEGTISGGIIQNGSLDGDAIKKATIDYAKIGTAAIEQLYADSITALSAHIKEITTETIETDEISAAFAHLSEIVSDYIQAGSIDVDSLAAKIIDTQVLISGTAEFDQATVKHLVSNVFNLDGTGTAEEVYIYNLLVTYAQITSAIVDSLAIKSDDGHYYKITISSDGSFIPVQIPDSEIDIDHRMTTDGKRALADSILTQEQMTATGESGPTIHGIVGVINNIYAATISTDVLMATEGFISRLKTAQIVGDNSIEFIANQALNVNRLVRLDSDGVHIGDSESESEVLIDSNSVNVRLSGRNYSKFSANYVQFGNYQLRKTADGGLAFKFSD